MKTCLSEKAFQAILSGSAQAEQLTRWRRHLRECDTCAAHLIRLQTNDKDIQKQIMIMKDTGQKAEIQALASKNWHFMTGDSDVY